MKTIFITIFEGVEVKNILRTPIIENLLKGGDVRLVFFTKSEQKVEYYKKEFPNKDFIFEVVQWQSQSYLDKFFSKMKFTLLRTESTNLKRRLVAEYEGRKIHYYAGLLLNYIVAWPFIRKIVRLLDFYLVNESIYNAYFEKYKPDLVFLAHLFDDPEIALLREAKKRKVKSVGFVNSWDKVTSRSIMRLLPDKIIVFNDIVKKEVMAYDEMKERDIFVSGLPQYDFFYTTTPVSREEFFKKINCDTEKKLIVYAVMGRAFSSSDWDMIDFLSELIKSEEIKHNCELLVRFQPNDFIDMEEIKKRPYLKYDNPGIRFGTKRGVDWDMNKQDLFHLRDTLSHMSLLICYASSLSVDAAVFDKPVININFEIKENDKLIKSPTQYYHSTHYKNALNTGGIRLVDNKESLIETINSYLENSHQDSLGRKILIKEQTAFIDGLSGERIAQFLLQQII